MRGWGGGWGGWWGRRGWCRSPSAGWPSCRRTRRIRSDRSLRRGGAERGVRGWGGGGGGGEGGGVGGGGVAVLQLVGHHVAELVEFDLAALIIVRWCN